MDHVHDAPLPALGRVDRRQVEPVVVEVGLPGEVAGAGRRVEGQVGEEPAPVAGLGSERLESLEVGQPGLGIGVAVLEDARAELS